MSENYDSIFEQYAAQKEKESKLSQSNRGSSFQRNYEDIHWTALETNKTKVIRVMGGPPDSNLERDNGSGARSVTICWLVGDDGKKFKVIRPDEKADPNYILNRIINKVKTVKWVNDPSGKGTKTYPIQEKYPDIYNIVDKNGLTPADKRWKFEKGWGGKQVFIMNVIDRERMEEHRALNHTMLLAKSVSVGNNDAEYYDEGISTFAISKRLEHLFRSYGSWEKYDIAITRTGDLNNPYLMVNASNSPMEVDPSIRNFISTEQGLTDEEKSFERYDLSKLYRYTTATKIYNRLKNTIAKIDKYLDTDFLKDLEAEVAKEKVMFDELYKDEREEAPVSTPATPVADPVVKQTESVSTPAPAVRTRTSVIEAAPGSNLPYYNTLSDELKKHITRAVIKDDGTCDIDWDLPTTELAGCPTCGTASPLEATECPFCGVKF